MKDLEALNEKANERNVGEVGVKESFSGKKRKLQQDSVELEKDVEVEYIRNPASAPSFASSSLSLLLLYPFFLRGPCRHETKGV